MSKRVRITDVSPRDGLQNEPGVIATADKVRLVELLGGAGVDEVEVSSFVSPKWVPQLADATDVFAALRGRKPPGVVYSALVPNEHGMRAALSVNQAAGERLIDKVAVFTAASETSSRRNTNATIAETLERFVPVVRLARESALPVRGYVSCAVQCPYEGPVAPERVADVAARLLDLGVDEIDLGETIGAGTPESVSAMLEAVMSRLGAGSGGAASAPLLTLHLHDTFGRAADCVRAALRLGVRSFDGAAGGLGGCPFASTPARRVPGNIATETLARVVIEEGYAVGLNPEALALAAAHARGLRAGA